MSEILYQQFEASLKLLEDLAAENELKEVNQHSFTLNGETTITLDITFKPEDNKSINEMTFEKLKDALNKSSNIGAFL